MDQEAKHTCKIAGLRKIKGFDASSVLGAPFPIILHDGVHEKYCTECDATLGHILDNPTELIAVSAILRGMQSRETKRDGD